MPDFKYKFGDLIVANNENVGVVVNANKVGKTNIYAVYVKINCCILYYDESALLRVMTHEKTKVCEL